MNSVQQKILKLILILAIWLLLLICFIKIKTPYEDILKTSMGSQAFINKILTPRNLSALERLKAFINNKVLVDYRKDDDDEQLIKDGNERIPSLPNSYWTHHKAQPTYAGNNQCAQYPTIFKLQFRDTYWQLLETTNGSFQLLSAYYDIRNSSSPVVRILGTIDRIAPTVKTFCQFWFEDQKAAVTVETSKYDYIWHSYWGGFGNNVQPYLIKCSIPKEFESFIPTSISIVENQCDMATNNLRVIYNLPADGLKKEFGVCHKGLDFLYDDKSVKLIEWIELITLLGADKIYFYDLQIHPNVSKVLKYYQQEGKVHVTPLSLPGNHPKIPGKSHMNMQNELIPYNDCFYKNMYKYNFIALFDIDEVIMPKQQDVLSWHDLMARILVKAKEKSNSTYASFNVRNVYFFNETLPPQELIPDIPKYMHMLQHVNRAPIFNPPGACIKCFHNPELVLSLHNHFPMECLNDPCNSFDIQTEDAQLQHYRADCGNNYKQEDCDTFRKTTIKDMTIHKFKDQLILRTTTVLDALGFYENLP